MTWAASHFLVLACAQAQPAPLSWPGSLGLLCLPTSCLAAGPRVGRLLSVLGRSVRPPWPLLHPLGPAAAQACERRSSPQALACLSAWPGEGRTPAAAAGGCCLPARAAACRNCNLPCAPRQLREPPRSAAHALSFAPRSPPRSARKTCAQTEARKGKARTKPRNQVQITLSIRNESKRNFDQGFAATRSHRSTKELRKD